MEPIESPGTGPTPIVPAALRVLGVGRAGARIVEGLHGAGLAGVSLTVLSPEDAVLESIRLPDRRPMGRTLTRGLGAGGDPAQGRACAEAEESVIRELAADGRVVFVVAGLGGGTGSGAAPAVARIAREAGALVVGVVTLPFKFEGRLREGHAAAAFDALRSAADAVICIPNQQVLSTVPEKAPIHEVFAAANRLVAGAVGGIVRLLVQPGEIALDFSHLERLLRGRHAESVMASAAARGEHRAREVVEQLLAHPFLNGGDVLGLADGVLLSLASGPGLPAQEVGWIVDQVQRQCDHAEVVVGTTIDPSLADGIHVTLIAARGGSVPVPERVAADSPPAPVVGGDEGLLGAAESRGSHAGARLVPPAPELTPEQKGEVLARAGGRTGIKRRKPVQTLFNFDVVSKGRFEKTEATILHGEDLDLPTFIRRGYSLN